MGHGRHVGQPHQPREVATRSIVASDELDADQRVDGVPAGRGAHKDRCRPMAAAMRGQLPGSLGRLRRQDRRRSPAWPRCFQHRLASPGPDAIKAPRRSQAGRRRAEQRPRQPQWNRKWRLPGQYRLHLRRREIPASGSCSSGTDRGRADAMDRKRQPAPRPAQSAIDHRSRASARPPDAGVNPWPLAAPNTARRSRQSRPDVRKKAVAGCWNDCAPRRARPANQPRTAQFSWRGQ